MRRRWTQRPVVWIPLITDRVRCPGRRRCRRTPNRDGTSSTTSSKTICRSHAGSHCSTRRRYCVKDARHDAPKHALTILNPKVDTAFREWASSNEYKHWSEETKGGTAWSALQY